MPGRSVSKRPNTRWIITFADLMSVLVCFFVLLLSFSEMDLQKYRMVAGSMAQAFGVQRDQVVRELPLGTSFVAREFSPTQADPAPLDAIQQTSSPFHSPPGTQQRTQQWVQGIAARLHASLEAEIRRGSIHIETREQKIIIRIQEQGSFPSGSAELMEPFKPTMAKIAQALLTTPVQIVVAGHTDNIPIANERFRSNWELSASRAVTVVHELLSSSAIPMERFRIEGHGEVRPLAANNTVENRALNRRVEIILEQDPETGIRRQPVTDQYSLQPQ